MKKMNKKTFGLVVLGLICTFFLTGLSVFAVDPDSITYCKETDTSANIVGRYKIKVDNIGGNTYSLTMSDGCDENVGFKVESVNGNTSNDAVGKEVTCNSTVSITAEPTYDNDFGLPGISVKMVSTGPILAYKEEANSCYWRSASAEVYTTAGGQGATTEVQYQQGQTIDPSGIDSVIDCDNNTFRKAGVTNPITPGSFEDKFCNAKRKAIAAGNNRDFGTGKYTGDPTNFKCDYHIENVPLVPDELEGDAYFVNKSYLYGVTKLSKEAQIVHHYYPGAPDDVTTETLTCEIECQESVEVEYGPPVATVAGVCFEYNVRATSRVACNMTKVPPKTNLCAKNYCTPYPQCKHSGGTIYTQAGPSEDYDACIKSCDGGKYTKKCSNKCYTKVYGKNAAAKVKSAAEELVATRVKTDYTKGQNGADFDCNGYYTKTGGEIVWNGGDSAGRWYCDYGWKERELSYRKSFYTDGAGFFRKEFGSGSLCSADCYWTQCGGNVYLNKTVPCNKVPGLSSEDKEKYCKDGQINILEYDCAKNTETYNAFVQECMSSASCSTTTAEFTISTEYAKLGSSTVTKLNFPYDNQKDTIQNNGSATITTADQKNSTLLVNYPTDGIGLLGCYKGVDQKDLYRATWGFPASWMNLKTGEVSYNPSGKTGGTDGGSGNVIWFEHPHRFCVPGDAKGVNVLWYNAFMHRVLVEKHILEETSASSITNCGYGSSTYSITSQTVGQYVTSENAIKYNIHAKTRKFGFLEWDIDVDCFYAINENTVCGSYENDKCMSLTKEVENNCTPKGGYRVRTTDLTDMFPSESGSTLNDTSKAGREVGYNWSQYAVNKKNVNYSSNPPAYMAKVQNAGKAMYDESNLDYEFYLSPKTIREMRRQINGSVSNYTAFSDSGFKADKNGISRYRSAKIHGGNSVIPDADKKVPPENSAAISCNNMINWRTTDSCDPVHD